MKKSRLFALLPEYVSTSDSMAIESGIKPHRIAFRNGESYEWDNIQYTKILR